METSLEYKLIIKGREAKIGSELWFNEGDGISKVTIDKISIFKSQSPQIRLKNEKDKYTFFRIENLGFIECFLYWEKPIIYQLPDTEGNLSEVKIGQEVWSKRHNENPVSCKIIRFDRGDIVIESQQHTKQVFNVHNISGLGLFVDVTTNRPKRDFRPYFDFNQAPDGFDYGTIDRSGYAFWFYIKPLIDPDSFWESGGYSTISAGYRQNLINPATGSVDDWEDSLVERPKGK